MKYTLVFFFTIIGFIYLFSTSFNGFGTRSDASDSMSDLEDYISELEYCIEEKNDRIDYLESSISDAQRTTEYLYSVNDYDELSSGIDELAGYLNISNDDGLCD